MGTVIYDVLGKLGGLWTWGDARFGVFARGVDLDVDVQRGGGRERGAACVELGSFLESVDRGDEVEIGDLGGEWFAFIWIWV